MQDMKALLSEKKIIAILRRVPAEKLDRVILALREGGVRFMEVTFDQSSPTCLTDTAAAIRRVGELAPDVYAGAGTVLTAEQAEAAAAAGAKYVISPDVNPAVIRRTTALGMISMPGALTPSEVLAAYREGASYVKIFPAGDLGPAYIRAIRAPISHIPLLAVGGVDLDNMADFFRAGICGFGIGGNILKKDLLARDDYAGLTELAARYTARAAELTKG